MSDKNKNQGHRGRRGKGRDLGSEDLEQSTEAVKKRLAGEVEKEAGPVIEAAETAAEDIEANVNEVLEIPPEVKVAAADKETANLKGITESAKATGAEATKNIAEVVETATAEHTARMAASTAELDESMKTAETADKETFGRPLKKVSAKNQPAHFEKGTTRSYSRGTKKSYSRETVVSETLDENIPEVESSEAIFTADGNSIVIKKFFKRLGGKIGHVRDILNDNGFKDQVDEDKVSDGELVKVILANNEMKEKLQEIADRYEEGAEDYPKDPEPVVETTTNPIDEDRDDNGRRREIHPESVEPEIVDSSAPSEPLFNEDGLMIDFNKLIDIFSFNNLPYIKNVRQILKDAKFEIPNKNQLLLDKIKESPAMQRTLQEFADKAITKETPEKVPSLDKNKPEDDGRRPEIRPESATETASPVVPEPVAETAEAESREQLFGEKGRIIDLAVLIAKFGSAEQHYTEGMRQVLIDNDLLDEATGPRKAALLELIKKTPDMQTKLQEVANLYEEGAVPPNVEESPAHETPTEQTYGRKSGKITDEDLHFEPGTYSAKPIGKDTRRNKPKSVTKPTETITIPEAESSEPELVVEEAPEGGAEATLKDDPDGAKPVETASEKSEASEVTNEEEVRALIAEITSLEELLTIISENSITLSSPDGKGYDTKTIIQSIEGFNKGSVPPREAGLRRKVAELFLKDNPNHSHALDVLHVLDLEEQKKATAEKTEAESAETGAESIPVEAVDAAELARIKTEVTELIAKFPSRDAVRKVLVEKSDMPLKSLDDELLLGVIVGNAGLRKILADNIPPPASETGAEDDPTPEAKEGEGIDSKKFNNFFRQLELSDLQDIDVLKEKFNHLVTQEVLNELHITEANKDVLVNRYFENFCLQSEAIMQDKIAEASVAKTKLKKLGKWGKREGAKFLKGIVGAGKYALITKGLFAAVSTVIPLVTPIKLAIGGAAGGISSAIQYMSGKGFQRFNARSMKSLAKKAEKMKDQGVKKEDIFNQLKIDMSALMNFDKQQTTTLKEQSLLAENLSDELLDEVFNSLKADPKDKAEGIKKLFKLTEEAKNSEGSKQQRNIKERQALIKELSENYALDEYISHQIKQKLKGIIEEERKKDSAFKLSNEHKNQLTMKAELIVSREMNVILGDIVAQEKFDEINEKGKSSYQKSYIGKLFDKTPPESLMQAMTRGFVSGAVASAMFTDATAGFAYMGAKRFSGAFRGELLKKGQSEVKTAKNILSEFGEFKIKEKETTLKDAEILIKEARSRIKLPDIKEAERAKIELAINKLQGEMIVETQLRAVAEESLIEIEDLASKIVGARKEEISGAALIAEQERKRKGWWGLLKTFYRLPKKEKRQVIWKALKEGAKGGLAGAIGAGLVGTGGAVYAGEVDFDASDMVDDVYNRVGAVPRGVAAGVGELFTGGDDIQVGTSPEEVANFYSEAEIVPKIANTTAEIHALAVGTNDSLHALPDLPPEILDKGIETTNNILNEAATKLSEIRENTASLNKAQIQTAIDSVKENTALGLRNVINNVMDFDTADIPMALDNTQTTAMAGLEDSLNFVVDPDGEQKTDFTSGKRFMQALVAKALVDGNTEAIEKSDLNPADMETAAALAEISEKLEVNLFEDGVTPKDLDKIICEFDNVRNGVEASNARHALDHLLQDGSLTIKAYQQAMANHIGQELHLGNQEVAQNAIENSRIDIRTAVETNDRVLLEKELGVNSFDGNLTPEEIKIIAEQVHGEKSDVATALLEKLHQANLISDQQRFSIEHAAIEHTGFKASAENSQNLSLELGKDGAPKYLEQVFYRIGIDSMTFGEGGVTNVEGAQILNVGANLRVLSEGHGLVGITAEEFQKYVSIEDGKVTITNFNEFQKNIIVPLVNHAEESITANNLPDKGATAYIDNIIKDTWEDMLSPKGIEAGQINFDPAQIDASEGKLFHGTLETSHLGELVTDIDFDDEDSGTFVMEDQEIEVKDNQVIKIGDDVLENPILLGNQDSGEQLIDKIAEIKAGQLLIFQEGLMERLEGIEKSGTIEDVPPDALVAEYSVEVTTKEVLDKLGFNNIQEWRDISKNPLSSLFTHGENVDYSDTTEDVLERERLNNLREFFQLIKDEGRMNFDPNTVTIEEGLLKIIPEENNEKLIRNANLAKATVATAALETSTDGQTVADVLAEKMKAEIPDEEVANFLHQEMFKEDISPEGLSKMSAEELILAKAKIEIVLLGLEEIGSANINLSEENLATVIKDYQQAIEDINKELGKSGSVETISEDDKFNKVAESLKEAQPELWKDVVGADKLYEKIFDEELKIDQIDNMDDLEAVRGRLLKVDGLLEQLSRQDLGDLPIGQDDVKRMMGENNESLSKVEAKITSLEISPVEHVFDPNDTGFPETMTFHASEQAIAYMFENNITIKDGAFYGNDGTEIYRPKFNADNDTMEVHIVKHDNVDVLQVVIKSPEGHALLDAVKIDNEGIVSVMPGYESHEQEKATEAEETPESQVRNESGVETLADMSKEKDVTDITPVPETDITMAEEMLTEAYGSEDLITVEAIAELDNLENLKTLRGVIEQTITTLEESSTDPDIDAEKLASGLSGNKYILEIIDERIEKVSAKLAA